MESRTSSSHDGMKSSHTDASILLQTHQKDNHKDTDRLRNKMKVSNTEQVYQAVGWAQDQTCWVLGLEQARICLYPRGFKTIFHRGRRGSQTGHMGSRAPRRIKKLRYDNDSEFA